VEITAGELLLVQGQELAPANRGLGQTLALVVGAVAPDDVVGATEPGGVVHPSSDGVIAAHGEYVHGTATAAPGSIVLAGVPGWGRMAP
jgi:hypothetical protein